MSESTCASSEESPVTEREESLWWLAASPGIWVAHFVASYGTAAVFCARAADALDGRATLSLSTVRIAIAVYSVVAVAGIIAVGVRGFRRHRSGAAATAHDFDTPEARTKFLGFAGLLLSGLSLVGTIYVGMPTLFLETCR